VRAVDPTPEQDVIPELSSYVNQILVGGVGLDRVQRVDPDLNQFVDDSIPIRSLEYSVQFRSSEQSTRPLAVTPPTEAMSVPGPPE
jgi:hypothetical protein